MLAKQMRLEQRLAIVCPPPPHCHPSSRIIYTGIPSLECLRNIVLESGSGYLRRYKTVNAMDLSSVFKDFTCTVLCFRNYAKIISPCLDKKPLAPFQPNLTFRQLFGYTFDLGSRKQFFSLYMAKLQVFQQFCSALILIMSSVFKPLLLVILLPAVNNVLQLFQ